jgi:hypothetical protein
LRPKRVTVGARKEIVMTRTRLGWLLVLVGGAVLVVSLLADPIGLGSSDGAFGWKQVTGTVVGAIVLAVGAVALIRARRGGDAEQPTEAA